MFFGVKNARCFLPQTFVVRQEFLSRQKRNFNAKKVLVTPKKHFYAKHIFMPKNIFTRKDICIPKNVYGKLCIITAKNVFMPKLKHPRHISMRENYKKISEIVFNPRKCNLL